MKITLVSKNKEQTFDKDRIVIGSKPECDFVMSLGFEFTLIIDYEKQNDKIFLSNNFQNKNFLFKGKYLPEKLEIGNVCKIIIPQSDDFITIRVKNWNSDSLQETQVKEKKSQKMTALSVKSQRNFDKIEKERISIIKECGFIINDLKRKMRINSINSIILHIALLLSSFICAFGSANYLLGIGLSESGSIIEMPVNIKFIFILTLIIYSVTITLKQGIYLYLANKSKEVSPARFAERFLILASLVFFVFVYLMNLIYYSSSKLLQFFSIFISSFFVSALILLSFACGHLKYSSTEVKKELEKQEYRTDFELVIKELRSYIDEFVNGLSSIKIENLQNRLINLRLKFVFEVMLGLLTSPFLAYGVSNTLASCFPEAAGWIRISGLRFSPVFLVLATMLIIFAFFSFVNAFFLKKKIQASNVIKRDGFHNYLQHGVDIFGLAGIKKLEVDMRISLIISMCIIFIEFLMNSSYFMQEIGSNLNGIFLSIVAALVPTALLIAETFLLSQTKFEISVCEGTLSKCDKE